MASKVRPWQGTVLGVLCYIGTALAVIVALMMIFGASFAGGLMGIMSSGLSETFNTAGQLTTEEAAMMSGAGGAIGGLFGFLGMFAAIFILFLGFIDYLIGKAVMSGKKWGLIVVIVFAALGLLSALSTFEIVSIVISGVLLALPVTVLNDPYYNSKS